MLSRCVEMLHVYVCSWTALIEWYSASFSTSIWICTTPGCRSIFRRQISQPSTIPILPVSNNNALLTAGNLGYW